MNIGYAISAFIAGLILISLVALNSRIVRGSGEHTLYTMAKIQSDMIADYVKDDMRRMGYRVPGNSIILAEDNRIRFRVTRGEGATPEERVIDWWFFDDAEENDRNPNVMPLFRRESLFDPAADQTVEANYDPYDPIIGAVELGVGVVDFTFEYLGSDGIVIDPSTQGTNNIRHIRLSISVESMDSYDPNRFERSVWQGEITPLHL